MSDALALHLAAIAAALDQQGETVVQKPPGVGHTSAVCPVLNRKNCETQYGVLVPAQSLSEEQAVVHVLVALLPHTGGAPTRVRQI